jgi:3-oxoacyl-[acyl-carrier-protein] synthase II
MVETKRVVITGIGVITPIGSTPEDYWRSCREGVNGIGPMTIIDASQLESRIAAEVKDFDPRAHLSFKDAKRMDRFTQFASAAALDAVADSGIEIDKEDANRVGVLIGSGIGGLKTVTDQQDILREHGPNRVSPFLIPMLITNMASGYVSILLNIKGPNLSISTACATASHALGEAAHIIKEGDADVMIAGGSEAAITVLGVAGFCSMKALSTRNEEPEKASRPFDKERDGFVIGEGAGVMVLESYEHARKRGARMYCELRGYGATGDAYHLTAPAPDGEGAVRAMKASLDDAGLDPSEIDYINAHGTSTPLNDKTETAAIKAVFGDRAYKIPISSTKSMIGHLLGASGCVELVSCCCAIRDGVVHPTINYEVPDPECDLDYVPNEAREADVRHALSNSLGFGGHNATLIVSKI